MEDRRVSTTTKAETTMAAIRIRERVQANITKRSLNMLENKVATREMKILNLDTRNPSTTKEVLALTTSQGKLPRAVYPLVESLNSIPINID